MTGEFKDWARRLRVARRAQGISQSELAHEVGCRQSAISMMERGHAAALSRETLRRIGERLGVAFDEATPVRADGAANLSGRAYCTNSECPSNIPVCVGDGVTFWPTTQPVSGGYCGICGEVRAFHCPNPDCRAPAREGACCMECGTPWVIAPPEAETNPGAWAEQRQRAIAAWRSLCSENG